MSGLEILLIIVLSYVGIGFGVAIASGCEGEDYPVGKGCVWPLYLVVEATKAISDLVQELKEVKEEFNSKK